jgi:hypothetical protein
MGMTQMSINHVTIGIKNGRKVAGANAESPAEAHENGAAWLRRGVVDTYEVWANGERLAIRSA